MDVIVLVLAPAVASAKVKHPVYDIVEKLGAPESKKHLEENRRRLDGPQ